MFARLSVTLVLALACAAHPLINTQADKYPVTLPVAKRRNFTGAAKLIEHDQHRVKKLLSVPTGLFEDDHSTTDQVSLTNTLVSYTAQVGVGHPATLYELIVDTGSSNTWVGADRGKRWHPTSTSHSTGRAVQVTYGSGYFSGTEVIDRVTIGDMVLRNQSIGSAMESTGFMDVDGILGIGPTGLTRGSTVPETATIPTVVDTAAEDGLIRSKIVGIYFQPPTEDGDVNGALTFGHVDHSKLVGDLYEVPITSASPANRYVGIDQSITYGSAGTAILSSTSGIVDTGTSLILLATSAYDTYMNSTGATYDEDVGLLSIPAEAYDSLESLYFHIGSHTYELTANAQIWPRSLNEEIGGTNDTVYLIVGDAGANAGGMDFISGQAFLERFYTTYDSGNSLFGIAETVYTYYKGN